MLSSVQVGRILSVLVSSTLIWFLLSRFDIFSHKARFFQLFSEQQCCNYKAASRFFTHRGFFANPGSWGKNMSLESFDPLPCLKRSSANCTLPFKRIAILGDSQGSKYTQALVKRLERVHNMKCASSEREPSSPNSYFGVDRIITTRQDCAGCVSFRTTCKPAANAEREIHVEYIRMEFTIDFEISTPVRIHWDNNCIHNGTNPAAPCKWHWSSQQVIFQHYLQARKPDEVHIFQNISTYFHF